MRIFALMRGKSDTEIAMICQWDNQAIELLYDCLVLEKVDTV